MASSDTREIVEEFYRLGSEMASGGEANALHLFHDEFQFTVTGQMPVSGTYDLDFMKSNVKSFGGAPKSPTYGHYPMEYIVDGDSCVVICQGHINGPGSVPYNNTYLMLFKIKEGKIVLFFEDPDASRFMLVKGDTHLEPT